MAASNYDSNSSQWRGKLDVTNDSPYLQDGKRNTVLLSMAELLPMPRFHHQSSIDCLVICFADPQLPTIKLTDCCHPLSSMLLLLVECMSRLERVVILENLLRSGHAWGCKSRNPRLFVVALERSRQALATTPRKIYDELRGHKACNGPSDLVLKVKNFS